MVVTTKDIKMLTSLATGFVGESQYNLALMNTPSFDKFNTQANEMRQNEIKPLPNIHTGKVMEIPGITTSNREKQMEHKTNKKTTSPEVNTQKKLPPNTKMETIPVYDNKKVMSKKQYEAFFKNMDLIASTFYSHLTKVKNVEYDDLKDTELQAHFVSFIDGIVKEAKSNKIDISFTKEDANKLFKQISKNLKEQHILVKIGDGTLTQNEVFKMSGIELTYYNDFHKELKKDSHYIKEENYNKSEESFALINKEIENRKKIEEAKKAEEVKKTEETKKPKEEKIVEQKQVSQFQTKEKFKTGTFNFMLKYGMNPDKVSEIINSKDFDKKLLEKYSVTEIAFAKVLKKDKEGNYFVNNAEIQNWAKMVDGITLNKEMSIGGESNIQLSNKTEDELNKLGFYPKTICNMLEAAEKGESLVGKYPASALFLVGLMKKKENTYSIDGEGIKKFKKRDKEHWAGLNGEKKLEDSQIVKKVVEKTAVVAEPVVKGKIDIAAPSVETKEEKKEKKEDKKEEKKAAPKVEVTQKPIVKEPTLEKKKEIKAQEDKLKEKINQESNPTKTTTIDFNLLVEEEIKKLTEENLKQLSVEIFNSLTEKQVKAFTSKQITFLVNIWGKLDKLNEEYRNLLTEKITESMY